jgi:hypothetical protein
MTRRPAALVFLALLGFTAFSPVLASGPTGVRSGDVVQGELERGDDVLAEDGSLADYYLYRGARGEQLVVEMVSEDFDAYLLVGTGSGSRFEIIESDDDGAGGTNARLRVTLPEDGLYTIVANSLSSGETGQYTLRVGASEGAPTPEGEPMRGRLETSDLVLEDDGTYYDAYVFEARAGDRIAVRMSSSDFDTYLMVASGTPEDLDILASDDDSAGGTDAQLEFVFPSDGTYTLLANSYDRATGDYLLTVSRQGSDRTCCGRQ